MTARLVMPLGRHSLLLATGTGQSENPRSRHFADLSALLHGGAYHEVPLDGPAGSAAAALVLRPSSAGRQKRGDA